MEKILQQLRDWDIDYIRYDHQAFFSFEEGSEFFHSHPGGHCKNLFLRNAKGTQHYLVSLPGEKRINLTMLAQVLGESSLSFASPERLARYLAVTPGSVSLLGLINDRDHHVKVCIDQDLWHYENIFVHPNLNTSTLEISCVGIEKFLNAVGNQWQIMMLPVVSTDDES